LKQLKELSEHVALPYVVILAQPESLYFLVLLKGTASAVP
jgi:hypothetical protein